jgi:acyl-CoA synthetase (NDP forming)
MEHGMTAIGNAVWWHETRRSASGEQPGQAAEAALLPVSGEISGEWTETEARALLQAHDIPVVPGLLAMNEQEAVEAARKLGLPVVLKIQSRDILHKSDIGGVLLRLATEDDVRRGFAALLANVRRHRPEARIAGVLVTPMRPEGIELLVGVIRDPVWGQIVTVAPGGIWVEVSGDSSVRVLPVTREDIKKMLSELRGAALLNGSRGRPAADIERLAEVILRVTLLAQRLGDRLEALEINPLLVSGSNIEALDVLITWNGS